MNAIENGFLEEQRRRIEELAAESDILDVEILDRRTFRLHYDCRGLVALRDGSVREHRGFEVSFFLHEDYLRRVNPALLLNLVAPVRCFAPNVVAPLMCIGEVTPGTPLVELAMRAYEVLTYQNFGATERDALRPDACAYVRANLERFPIDSRPLKWRRTETPATGDRGARP